MGTRGFCGVVVDGNVKVGYQQYDSYPGGVGLDVLNELYELVKDMDSFKTRADNLEVVNEETPIPDNAPELMRDRGYNPGNPNGGELDWYWLLRETQGSIKLKLQAGWVLDASDFPMDSLFCEWGYLVDLDQGTFEIYEGFQREKPENGRWKDQRGLTHEGNPSEYYPCKLRQVWSLNDLPTNDEFLAELQDHDEEEE